MSLPVKDVANLLPLSGGVKLNSGQSTFAPGNSQKIFNDILQEAVGQTNNPASPAAAVPLDKSRIALMIKTIQLQMNRQLFNIVINNQSQESNLPISKIISDYTAAKNIAATDTSINRQTSPKNNVSRADINLEKIIEKAARIYDVDADLIRSVIKAESNFDPQATSAKGAMGLMQLMPATASALQVEDAFHPENNIEGGVRYLRYLLNTYRGNLTLTLAAYNAGEGNIAKYNNNVPPFRETRNYIKRVLSYYKSFSKQ